MTEVKVVVPLVVKSNVIRSFEVEGSASKCEHWQNVRGVTSGYRLEDPEVKCATPKLYTVAEYKEYIEGYERVIPRKHLTDHYAIDGSDERTMVCVLELTVITSDEATDITEEGKYSYNYVIDNGKITSKTVTTLNDKEILITSSSRIELMGIPVNVVVNESTWTNLLKTYPVVLFGSLDADDLECLVGYLKEARYLIIDNIMGDDMDILEGYTGDKTLPNLKVLSNDTPSITSRFIEAFNIKELDELRTWNGAVDLPNTKVKCLHFNGEFNTTKEFERTVRRINSDENDIVEMSDHDTLAYRACAVNYDGYCVKYPIYLDNMATRSRTTLEFKIEVRRSVHILTLQASLDCKLKIDLKSIFATRIKGPVKP